MATNKKSERELASKILSKVLRDKGFHFHTGIGAYTGIYATSLEQFSQLLEKVDLKSIEFHMGRTDFENWVRSLGDQVLALQLVKLKKKNPSGENLRREVRAIVKKRLDDLKRDLQHGSGKS